MASFKDNPVLAELDDIASALEKTGNADLATLVDECSAEIQTAPPRRASTKKRKKTRPKKKRPRRAKKNRKSAGASRTRRRQKVAAAMKKIASAQVSELEDIAAELVSEGERVAALEVLRIAEDLDSDYDYSKVGDHETPESKGDADKRYDRKKNLPKPKGDDANLEYPFEEGEGYPFSEGGEKSAFAAQLDDLIRLAMEEDMDMPPGEEEGDDEGDMPALDEGDDEGDDEGVDEGDDEGDEYLDDEGDEMPGEDMGDEMLGDEGEDDLAAFISALEGLGDEGEDETAAHTPHSGAGDRAYMADEEDMGDEMLGDEGEDDLDLGGLEEEMGEDPEDEEEMEDDPEEDTDVDPTAMDLMPNLDVKGPLGTGVSIASADKKRVVALARKLHKRGQKKLAQRVVNLLKKNK
jgi:hypothetical protein